MRRRLQHRHRVGIVFLILLVFLILEQGIILNSIIYQKPLKSSINSLELIYLNQKNVLFWLNYFQIKEPEVVLRQTILETGYYTSNVCIADNNILGLMSSTTSYYKFSHWIECIICYKYKIQSRMKKDENYYRFLERIKYSTDKNYIKKLSQINIENK